MGQSYSTCLDPDLKLCQATPLFSIPWNQEQGKGEGVTFNSFSEEMPQANYSTGFNVSIKSQQYLQSLQLLRKLSSGKQIARFFPR